VTLYTAEDLEALIDQEVVNLILYLKAGEGANGRRHKRTETTMKKKK